MHTDGPHPLVRYVLDLDRAALAKLRRSLAFPLGTWPGAFPFVEPFVAAAPRAQRRHAYLVAGLIAWARADGPGSGDLGEACARLRDSLVSDAAVERRFLALLDADEEGLPHHLRQLVALFAQHRVAPDWSRLLADLKHWSHPDRWVQQRWAKSFYARMARVEPDEHPTPAQEGFDAVNAAT